MDFEKEILEGFVVESREHLSSIEDDFLLLEKGKGKLDKELVNKVFRAIHTIKGAAGFLGLEKIGELSHVMETLLSMIRSGETVPDSGMIDVLLEGVDLLNSLLDDIEHNDTIDTAKVVEKLNVFLTKGVSKEVNTNLQKETPLPVPEGGGPELTINQYHRNRIEEKGDFLYVIKYDLEEVRETRGKSPMQVINELLQIGEIIEGRLETPLDDLSRKTDGSPLYYYVLYTCSILPEKIAEVLSLPPDRIQVAIEGKIEDTEAPEPASESTANSVTEESPEKEETVEAAAVSGTVEGGPASGIDKSTTVRIHINILDRLMNLASEMVLVRNQQLSRVDQYDPVMRSIVQRFDIVTTDLQETVMRTRMQPLGNVLGKYPRFVRELGKKLGKRIEIKMIGSEVELDKTILESLADPLTHIVRNSCDHGIEPPGEREKASKKETGLISINAFHEAGHINIEIKDDGRGIDVEAVKRKALEKGLRSEQELAQMNEKELVSLVMLPGFSTAGKVSDLSGRGVGMDVVKSGIEKLNGSLSMESIKGKGTSIHLKLPLTLAIIPCLVVMVGNNRYAIPQVNLEELVALYDRDVLTKIECAEDKEIFRLRNNLLPLVRLSEVLSEPEPFDREKRAAITEKYRDERKGQLQSVEDGSSYSLTFAVLKVGSQRLGLIIDKVIGTEEIVVKPMHPLLRSIMCYSGATVMGDGRVALILDVEGIASHTGILESGIENDMEDASLEAAVDDTQSFLLFKVGPLERFALALPMIKRIERIQTAEISKVGEKEFVTVDDVSTLILRLDQHLKVSPYPERDEMFLIMPKVSGKPFGILASSLEDIETHKVDLNVESYKEEGLLGTGLINNIMTLFIDIYRLVEIAEPGWFGTKRIKKHNSRGDGAKVLVVEDTSFFRESIRGYLASEGYRVTTAENGAKALEIMEKEEFSLVVSDLEMPVMDGWTFFKKMKENKDFADIPVIALSALDAQDVEDQVLEMGFDSFEQKLNRDRLLSAAAHSLTKQDAGR